MKFSGRARQSALKLVVWTLVGLLALFLAGFLATVAAALISGLAFSLVVLWVLFVVFTFYFFRDPEANVPPAPNLVVSPAHGTVDFVGQMTETQFMGAPCQRISIFLSVFNIHVQNAPVSGKLTYFKYTEGKFLNAMKTESAEENENLMFGFTSSERSGERIGVKLIAGLIARRIVPFINTGESVDRGQRISLIQFGSRTDLYLPLSARIKVKPGDKVVGGETVMATFD